MSWTNIVAAIMPGLAEALASIGTTVGIYKVVAAGAPVVAEDPGQRGKVMVLAFLPATQTMVYGFIYMFILYNSVLPALFAKYGTLPAHIASAILGISLFVGFVEMISAWMQGKVCAEGAAQLIKSKGAIFSVTLILAAYEELFGILGMVFGLLMVFIVQSW